MTGRERILKTIRGEIPDRVPLYDFLFQRDIFKHVLGKRAEEYDLIEVIDASRKLDLDLAFGTVSVPVGYEVKRLSDTQYIDEWGTTYQTEDASWPVDAPIAFPFSDYEGFKKYKFPNPSDNGRFQNIKEGVKYAKGEIAVSAGGNGPFTQAWMLMGPEELMINCLTEPDFIKALLKETTDYFIGMIAPLKEAGVDMITLAEDLGDSNQGFLPPATFKQLVLPELARIVDACGETPVFFHSCGNINEYLDDIVDTGITVLHPMQRTANMSLKQIKEKYGHRVTLCGNVDSSTTLPYGTPDDVEREVIECLEIAKPGGRYILASDHSLHDGISMENIYRMFEAGKKYGAY